MKITKPDITISDWEFSLPNDADTVAFFDPTLDDAKIAVVRKADADFIQASEALLDLAINYHDLISAVECLEVINRRLDAGIVEQFEEEKKNIKNTLKKVGCTIHNS